ncbi:MAG: SLBB domain-containing protein [Akkermansiaceae bacterium]|nr:SLBB domain-containing protein [Akkermansiaceae bacterium]
MKFIKTTCYLPLLLGLLIFPHLLQAETKSDLRASYILRPDDVVKMSVYEEKDLDSLVTILKAGQATFPLIGSLEIGGLSLNEASEEIRKRYAADYIRYPKVTLTVTEYATEFVSVIGQVKQPGNGTVPIPQVGFLDVGAALATVGGISETADPENIHLVTEDGTTRVLTYASIQGDLGRLKMNSGDKLIVNENEFARATVEVIGDVKKPGRYPVNKTGQMSLVSALATAGGLGPEADVLKIDVIISGKTTSYSYKEIQTGAAGRVVVKGGDSVRVPQSPFYNTTITILGEVKNAGAIALPLDGKLDLMKAIAMAGGFTELADLKKVSVTRGQRKTVYDVRKLGEKGRAAIELKPNDVVNVSQRWF